MKIDRNKLYFKRKIIFLFGNLVEIRIPKKFSVCIFILVILSRLGFWRNVLSTDRMNRWRYKSTCTDRKFLWNINLNEDEDTDRKFLRNPNLNEITYLGKVQKMYLKCPYLKLSTGEGAQASNPQSCSMCLPCCR
jgi:hypothetical protein